MIDLDEFTLKLCLDDAAHLTLDGSELLFRNFPDFERAADANGDNVYYVIIRALQSQIALSLIQFSVF